MDHLLDFFVSSAYADTTAAAPAQGGGFSFIIIIVMSFLFIYFAIWRPQNKRAREQQTLLGGLAKGDEVITAGGILGKLNKVTDQYVGLTLANNVEIIMQKSSVVSVLPKGTIKSIE